MKRWIFRYRGEANLKEAKSLVRILRRYSHIRIVDDNLPKMALIEAPTDDIKGITSEISPEWRIVEESASYPIPSTRKKLKT